MLFPTRYFADTVHWPVVAVDSYGQPSATMERTKTFLRLPL